MKATIVSEREPCENLLHTVVLRDPYAKDQTRVCVECGETVTLEVQVQSAWLTAAMRAGAIGIGYQSDRQGKAWENPNRAGGPLREYYRKFHPDFVGGEPSNTPDDKDE